MNYNRALAARYKGLAAFYMHKYKFTRHMWRRFNSKAIMHRRRAHAFGIRARKYWAMVIKYQAQWRKDSVFMVRTSMDLASRRNQERNNLLSSESNTPLLSDT